jgi:hypothetical protein
MRDRYAEGGGRTGRHTPVGGSRLAGVDERDRELIVLALIAAAVVLVVIVVALVVFRGAG